MSRDSIPMILMLEKICDTSVILLVQYFVGDGVKLDLTFDKWS